MGVVRPSGPLPSSVYWRRRLVVIGVPLAVLVLLVWLVAGRGSDANADPGTTTTSKAPTTVSKSGTGAGAGDTGPTPSPTSTGPGVPDCVTSALAVTVEPGAVTYAAGVSPAFTVTITNTGTDACLVDAGDAHRAIVVSSGKDRVWSSQDCAKTTTASRVLLLAPGKSDSQRVAWNRVRSAEGCPGSQAAAKAGSYKVAFTLGDAAAKTAKFTLR